MTENTLTALSQRDEAFWIGVALLFGGPLLAQVAGLGGTGLPRLLVGLGGLIIAVRLFVGIYRILRVTARAGWQGYREGRPEQ